jgi:hypothetical protein
MPYYTLQTESRAGVHYIHLRARDSFDATDIALNRNKLAYAAKVVREIDRAEFERLTGVSKSIPPQETEQ